MLPKAHLTSHSRVSGSRWVITPSWLSESLISFLYNSSVYYCHLFLISSASVKSIPFLSFIVPIFAWNVPLVSLIFYKGSLVFAILLFSSIFFALFTQKGFLISPCSLELCIQMVYLSFSPLPFSSLFFSAICEASSDHHVAFLHFLFLVMVLITASCTVLQTSVHSSSGTLSIRSNPLSICHHHCIIIRDLILVIPGWHLIMSLILLNSY